MSCSKSYFTIILCFFVLFLPEIVSANEKCDFIITKKDLKDLKNGKLYKSVETNGTACLKNYDSRYTYYPIKNGKIEGNARLYYYEDFIEKVTPYKNSKREGIERRYFPSGAVLSETPYKNDKVEGIEKVYFEGGSIESELPYKNDKIEGVRKDYYIDGYLSARINYKNDLKDGTARKYYRSGKIKLERTYKEGRKHGLEKDYTEEGILYNEAPFINGSINGTLKVFDKETGKPFLFLDFVNGIKQGKAVKYSPDGKIYAVINFENDYAVSGKCTNGYKLTAKDLETIQYSIYRIKCSK